MELMKGSSIKCILGQCRPRFHRPRFHTRRLSCAFLPATKRPRHAYWHPGLERAPDHPPHLVGKCRER